MLKITFKKVLYWLYDTFGLRFIWGKQCTHIDPITGKHKPKTFILWIIGIYIALFGVASQRYENRIDTIENRANAIFAQQGTSVGTGALSRISYVQNMKCPIKPALFRPDLTISSLFKETYYSEMVELLKDTVVLHKEQLSGANLSGANLSGLDLSKASLDGSNLSNANLEECDFSDASLRRANLSNSNLQKSKFIRADISHADLTQADLTESDLSYVKCGETLFINTILVKANLSKSEWNTDALTGADLTEADLRGAISFTKEALLNVKSLYKTKLDTSYIEYIKSNKPLLFEK